MLLLLAFATLGGMIGRNLHHFNKVLSHVNYSHSVQNVSIEFQQVIDYLAEAVPVAYPESLTRTIVALNRTLGEMDGLLLYGGFLSSDTHASMDMVRNFLAEQKGLDKIERNSASHQNPQSHECRVR